MSWEEKDLDDINLPRVNDEVSSDRTTPAETDSHEKLHEYPVHPNTKRLIAQMNEIPVESKKRTPVCSIFGNVNSGKTTLYDAMCKGFKITMETGDITQGIKAYNLYLSRINDLKGKFESVINKRFDVEYDKIVLIDTPGHDVFENFRETGSNLCDIAILMVDIFKGVHPQTIKSIELLRKNKIPFVVALNMIDRLKGWKSKENTTFIESYKNQSKTVKDRLMEHYKQIYYQFAENGINVSLFTKKKENDIKSFAQVIPISAKSCEGISDLLMVMLQICQKYMKRKFVNKSKVSKGLILETGTTEGLGYSIDVIWTHGSVKKGQYLLFVESSGKVIQSKIKLLLDSNDESKISSVNSSMGCKIIAKMLQNAVPGTTVIATEKSANIELVKKLKDEFESNSITIDVGESVDEQNGIFIHSNTAGGVQTLSTYLKENDIKIWSYGIGKINKKHVTIAARTKYRIILAFCSDVSDKSVEQFAKSKEVTIIKSPLIFELYKLFEKYKEKIESDKNEKINQEKSEAVFPCVFKIDSDAYVFRKKDPLILGVKILDGQLRTGVNIVVFRNLNGKTKKVEIGTVTKIISRNEKNLDKAEKGDIVTVEIQAPEGSNISFGRQVKLDDEFYTIISRRSLDMLKLHYKDEITRDIFLLLVQLKNKFQL